MGGQRPHLLSLGSLPGYPSGPGHAGCLTPAPFAAMGAPSLLQLGPELPLHQAPTPYSERPCMFFKLMQLRALKFVNDRVFHFPFI
jgi:hypothetical protein